MRPMLLASLLLFAAFGLQVAPAIAAGEGSTAPAVTQQEVDYYLSFDKNGDFVVNGHDWIAMDEDERTRGAILMCANQTKAEYQKAGREFNLEKNKSLAILIRIVSDRVKKRLDETYLNPGFRSLDLFLVSKKFFESELRSFGR